MSTNCTDMLVISDNPIPRSLNLGMHSVVATSDLIANTLKLSFAYVISEFCCYWGHVKKSTVLLCPDQFTNK